MWRLPGVSITAGVRTRVLAIALIPSAALLAAGSAPVAILTSQAYSVRQWSSYLGNMIDPVVGFVTALEGERTASMMVLGGTSPVDAALQSRRQATDAALARIAQMAASAAHVDPGAVPKNAAQFNELVMKMPLVRQQVDLRQIGPGAVDDFDTKLVGLISGSTQDTAAHESPNNDALVAETAGATLLQAADAHSRLIGIAAVGLSNRTPDPATQAAVGHLAGAYRQLLDQALPNLTEHERAEYTALTAGQAWRSISAAEDALAERGVLGYPSPDWFTDEVRVDSELISLAREQLHHGTDLTRDAASDSFTRSMAAAVGVLTIALMSFGISLLLANRVVRRLKALRSNSLDIANVRLPRIMERIHDGEAVDIESETESVDSGADEIGQVAAAFGVAQRAAIDAAIAEARTREGFNRVFLDIAFRNQAIVRRQLDVLDAAESSQSDPEHLHMLFQLDHLATRARRNAENLLILGGRQPGRRWRGPVSLEDIVRSAASETEGFARVSGVHLPDASVMGGVVADLVHLLAELVENAASFSPPDSPVSVRGNMVGRGVVVEIEDRGIGMSVELREQTNELLRDPPDFHAMAVSSSRNLGLFVVSHLARRNGIMVSLQESSYGGINAIVLIPFSALAVTDTTTPGNTPPTDPGKTPAGRLTSIGNAGPVSDNKNEIASEVEPVRGATARDTHEEGDGRAHHKTALPFRRRQTHIAPQLLLSPVPAAEDRQTAPGRLRTGESVRSAMTSLQRGTRQARQPAPDAAQTDSERPEHEQ